MTPAQLQCLVLARPMIEKGMGNGGADYICHALVDVSTDPALKKECLELMSYINQAISVDGIVSNTLETWQQYHGMSFTKEENKQNRLDWIDWMIKGYYLELYTRRSTFRFPQTEPQE